MPARVERASEKPPTKKARTESVAAEVRQEVKAEVRWMASGALICHVRVGVGTPTDTVRRSIFSKAGMPHLEQILFIGDADVTRARSFSAEHLSELSRTAISVLQQSVSDQLLSDQESTRLRILEALSLEAVDWERNVEMIVNNGCIEPLLIQLEHVNVDVVNGALDALLSVLSWGHRQRKAQGQARNPCRDLVLRAGARRRLQKLFFTLADEDHGKVQEAMGKADQFMEYDLHIPDIDEDGEFEIDEYSEDDGDDEEQEDVDEE